MAEGRAFRRAAFLCAALFALVSALAMGGATQAYDVALLEALRATDQPGQAGFPNWLLGAARSFTTLGAWPIRLGVALACGAILVARARRRDAAILVLSVAASAIALPLLKLLFGRARPDLLWRLADATSLSFPSGHAMGTMIVYPLVGFLLVRAAQRRIGLAAGVALALLIGATRVLLGVHWLSDVIGGWLLGGAWACVTLALLVRGEPGARGGEHRIASGAAVGKRRRDSDARG